MEQNRNKQRERTLVDHLAFDIWMALHHARQPQKKTKNEIPAETERRGKALARAIALHLVERCNYVIKRGPPTRGHSTEWKPRPPADEINDDT